MHLRHAYLAATDLSALAAFYTDALGLPALVRTHEQLTLAIGSASRLTFRAIDATSLPPALPPTYHFAFHVPVGSVEAAAAWLGARAPLLSYEGKAVVEFPNWLARAVYALDPAGNIIECIERRPLTDEPPAGVPFSAADLRGLSEIAVVVADVPAFVADCATRHGLPLFARQPGTSTFAAVGDDHGLLIVVPPGRAWFPTTDRRSIAAPLTVELTTATGQPMTLTWP